MYWKDTNGVPLKFVCITWEDDIQNDILEAGAPVTHLVPKKPFKRFIWVLEHPVL